MREVVIVEAVRTAIGKLGGALVNETPEKLGAHVLTALHAKAGFDQAEVDEIILGQAKQTADASNLARVAALQADYPLEIPAYTVHRQCGSGLQAIHSAAQQIMSGGSDLVIAGGVESMSTAPFYVNRIRFGAGSGNLELRDPNIASQPGSQPADRFPIKTMGETAENLAERYRISRQAQDEFAHESQLRAANAIKAGLFKDEIAPYPVKAGKTTYVFETDEHPRLTSVEKLSSLPPVFKQEGTVTAGNSSGRNDGAAALLIASREYAEKRGWKPKVKIIAMAAAGCDPHVMGLGPVYATQKALRIAGLALQDIDIIELNEAFAAQALACIHEMNLDRKRVNPNGGAIALGHPIGATGAILMTKLIYELARTGKRYGLATLCIAGGLGISTIVENCC